MNVAVIGLGKSGISAAAFLQKEGHRVFATDDKASSAPQGIHFLPAKELIEAIDTMDFVVISPGVPLTHPVAFSAKQHGIEVFCDVELAFRKIPQNIKAVGITGSNGKTTTTSLVGHILNSSSMPAKTVGNIGTPILAEIENSDIPLVIELSSFQLETMSTCVLDAACILNITPNHLDRHGSMQEYTKAKFRIGACLKPQGVLFVQNGIRCDGNVARFGFHESCEVYTDGKVVYYFGVNEGELPAVLQNSLSHDVENYLAAYALSRHLGVAPDAAQAAYLTFIKPKHRLQHVRTHNGIRYYDDSKATSVDAVLRAVGSIEGPIVLLAGGVHKGHPYTAWQGPFKEKVRACVLIGEAASLIDTDLQGVVPVHHAATFAEAFTKARELAEFGDAVLLSPGCASYDMFSSYEERGNKFQELVSNS